MSPLHDHPLDMFLYYFGNELNDGVKGYLEKFNEELENHVNRIDKTTLDSLKVY